MASEQRYLAYMVRLWTVRCNGDVVWRASAANAHTGEQRTFADLASLFDFFRDIAADSPCLLDQLEVGSEEE